MTRRRHVLAAFADGGFRRLYAVRVTSQFADGMFQASLAGAVLFNPERQAHAADIAAGFAVLLLPYSFIGPFAGVLLDRWSRQRILTVANAVRVVGVLGLAAEIGAGWAGLGFYASALVLISVGRFVLAALSAALPRVVEPAELVTANAFSTTSGTVAAAVGGGAALLLRQVLGDGNHGYALVAACAGLPYLLAAGVAAGVARTLLGPSDAERARRDTLRGVAAGLLAGLRHVRQRPAVFHGLSAIGVHRLCYGVSTVSSLLLYRNYFADDGFFRAGLGGLGQLVAAVAIGGGLASVVTPAAFRRFGSGRWPAALLLVAAVVEIAFGLPYRLALLLPAGLLLGFAAQSIKISVDTLVQQQVADEFRGRVFSIYDALFNVTLVLAAVLTATVLPSDGHSPASVVAIAGGYAATGGWYAWVSSRGDRSARGPGSAAGPRAPGRTRRVRKVAPRTSAATR